MSALNTHMPNPLIHVDYVNEILPTKYGFCDELTELNSTIHLKKLLNGANVAASAISIAEVLVIQQPWLIKRINHA